MRNIEFDRDMDMKFKEVLNDWAAGGRLSQEHSNMLKENVKKMSRMERNKKKPLLAWISTTAAAAVLLFAVLVMNVPEVRTWAAENIPIINRYIGEWTEIEKGWEWAEEHDMFQEVLVSTTARGYTVNIHKVLADPIQTTVFYSLEGSSPKPVYFDEILFNGSKFVTGMGARGDVIDGVYVGSMEFDPLPEYNGILTFIIESIGDIKGNWQVSFSVTREPLSQLTRSVLINKEFEVPAGLITVEELRLAPTQTELVIKYHGDFHGPDLSSRFVTLSLDGNEVGSRGGGGQGTLQEDGTWKEQYQVHFQPLEGLSQDSVVTIGLSGLLFHEGETILPFKGDRSSQSPDGRRVKIVEFDTNNEKGKAVISVEVDEKNPDPFLISYWQVIDDEGSIHMTEFPEVTGQSESTARFVFPGEEPKEIQERSWKIQWKLPADRTAVALINMGYWAYDDIGTVTVEIPLDMLN
ncbi:DUF4179 domain-containing protein [Candidatus Contubernalis alkaliaceticus]|uniref:DUF4179 domain-containing protein n=1 Tax=Candidatus Contubernalis alkaliaceticus TaxID=338645 RepID=UPI001F4C28DD|nr:DUF4179 domain-containing protein [Candidatus Contubernalis alkalaceticus]UNC92115.1 DUF4179 domain-containing protein [Candidatus Contubernalis alkalaceticus]